MPSLFTTADARSAVLGAWMVVLASSPASAQATRTPGFLAPARAFQRYEVGASGSLVAFENAALEGMARIGVGPLDLGVRGGVVDRGAIPGSTAVLGVEARARLVHHSKAVPVDAAIVAGVGTAAFDALFVPVGLSVGRRVDLSRASVVLYAQPTAALLQGADDVDGNRTVQVGLGVGADCRIGDALDVRASAGFFDYGEGLSVSLVWIR